MQIIPFNVQSFKIRRFKLFSNLSLYDRFENLDRTEVKSGRTMFGALRGVSLLRFRLNEFPFPAGEKSWSDKQIHGNLIWQHVNLETNFENYSRNFVSTVPLLSVKIKRRRIPLEEIILLRRNEFGESGEIGIALISCRIELKAKDWAKS